ncbi:WD repeat-containing protein 6 isoform X1 [Tanacetum coccineum]
MNSGQYIGEISALCFLHQSKLATSPPLLLAGTGSELLFYDLTTSQMIASFQVFNGIRVHGITLLTSSNSSPTYTVAVFGERKLKLFSFDIELPLVKLVSVESLPSFGHWILDVCFVKDCASEASRFLAVGCTDNSVYFWDTVESRISCEVRSPDKCLLYTMRMWGDKIDSLHVACGTIFNEIIVWKVVRGDSTSCLNSPAEDGVTDLCDRRCQAISVSDDRSARIWEVGTGQSDLADGAEVTVSHSSGPVLFGHSARVWDCCMSDSLIVTVGEDCTCRVWGLDGTQLHVIKEHM